MNALPFRPAPRRAALRVLVEMLQGLGQLEFVADRVDLLLRAVSF